MLDRADVEALAAALAPVRGRLPAGARRLADDVVAAAAELAATEIVRRAERRIGQLIREGQAAGEIRSQGQKAVPDDTRNSPTDLVPEHELSSNGSGIYAMTDGVDDDTFEAAIESGRDEGNLSRANVVRKVRAATEDQGDAGE